MSDHPISREVLARFADGVATAAERTTIVRHLLAGCVECQSQLRQCWPGSVGTVDAELGEHYYDAAFEHSVERALAAFAALSGSGSQPLLAELEGHPPKRQETLVRNQQRYWTTEFCSALIDRSHEARFTSTAVMCQQAHLAVLVAERLPPELFERETVEDCRARAWAALGNALRVSGDLNEAEKAFLAAQTYLLTGSGVAALRAQLLSQIASLRMDQRRFDDCLLLIQQVVQIWRNLGDRRELVRALVLQGIATGEGGKPRTAVRLLVEAGRLVDGEAEPKLTFIILHSIIRFHTDGGLSEVALRLYFEARQLYEQEADPLSRIKVLWLEGQIMSAERHLEPALKQLSAAREGFLAHANRYEAALVSLDLAAVLAKLGKFAEMRALVGETLREMQSRGVRREAIAALMLLQETATSETALLLIRRTAAALRSPGRRRRAMEGLPSLEQPFL
jgi:tetratricopeptide (TPR) repeat protein